MIRQTFSFLPNIEDYRRQASKKLAPHGFNIQESVCICCFAQTFFNIFDGRPFLLGLQFNVIKTVELLTNFAKRFVLHEWWSPESASTHCNLLVFYGYLLLLLLLYLHVVTIKFLFKLTTITSIKLYIEPCAEIVVITLRDKDRQVYLFR